MESRARNLLVIIALVSPAAHAQPAEPAPTSPAPPAPAEPAPPAPPVSPPTEAPPPPPSPGDTCRARRHDLEERASHTTDLQERARILQSLPDCSHPDAAAPPPVPAETAVTPVAVEAATGFALELQLETSLLQLNNDTALSQPLGGIFLGYRMPGATLGLGLDFERITRSMESGGSSLDSSSTMFLILPGVRVPLAHSSDGRTELLGHVDAGYGRLSISQSGAMLDTPAVQRIRVQAAPAVRFWVSRSFGVGAAVGLRYDRQSQDTSSGGTTSSISSSTLGLFSSFHVVGVF